MSLGSYSGTKKDGMMLGAGSAESLALLRCKVGADNKSKKTS